MTTCPTCHHVHTESDVTAVNRFDIGSATFYSTPDGELWLTREGAQAWLCDQRVRAATHTA